MTKFNVGDKVKVLRQDGVIQTFFPSIDGVFEVFDNYQSVDGERYTVAADDVTPTQIVHEDDLALYTAQESPQEDDEWGPWVFDPEGALSPSAMVIEYGGGQYIRHKVKKPVVKKQIEVGGSYVSNNDSNYHWECIHIDEGRGIAWMKKDNGTAYVWTLEGESISLPEEYNIDFSQNPKDQVPF